MSQGVSFEGIGRFSTVGALVVFAAIVGYSDPARAAICPEIDAEPVNVQIEKEPVDALSCVTVSVRGKWQNCQKPWVRMRNECDSALELDDDTLRCGVESGESTDCTKVAAGDVGEVMLGGQSGNDAERKTSEITGKIDQKPATIRLHYDYRDNGVPDSKGCGMGRSGAPASSVVLLMLFGLGGVRRR